MAPFRLLSAGLLLAGGTCHAAANGEAEGARVELVLAHYAEDLSWVSQYTGKPNLDVTIYSKADDMPEIAGAASQPLSNVGRESHSFLHHIVSNYHRLADWTLFSQATPPSWGYLFGESANGHLNDNVSFDDYLRPFPQGRDSMFVMTSATQFPQAAQATRLGSVVRGLPSEGAEACPKKGADGWTDWWFAPDHPHLHGGDMLQFYHSYISLDKNEGDALTLCFAQGARFAVSRARIQQRPRSYYSRLLALLAKDVNPQEGFWMEAAWYDVFHPEALQSETPLCPLPVARDAHDAMPLGPYFLDSVRQRVANASGDACSDCASKVDARRLYYGMYGAVTSTTVTTTVSNAMMPAASTARRLQVEPNGLITLTAYPDFAVTVLDGIVQIGQPLVIYQHGGRPQGNNTWQVDQNGLITLVDHPEFAVTVPGSIHPGEFLVIDKHEGKAQWKFNWQIEQDNRITLVNYSEAAVTVSRWELQNNARLIIFWGAPGGFDTWNNRWRSPVQVGTEYFRTADNWYCPADADVSSEPECRRAAKSLSVAFGYAFWGPDEHHNCLFANDGRSTIYWNWAGDAAAKAPAHGNPRYASICRKDTTTTSTMTTTKTNPTTRTITTTTTTASPLATDALQYLEASPLATESQQTALQWFVDEEVDWADFVADDHLQSLCLDTLQLKAGPRSKFLRWVKSKDILDGNGSMCIKIPREKAERIQAQRCV